MSSPLIINHVVNTPSLSSIHDSDCLICPPTPGRKHLIARDDNRDAVPMFFPRSCSILGSSDCFRNNEVKDDSKQDTTIDSLTSVIKKTKFSLTLKPRPLCEVDRRKQKICLDDLPPVPFAFPAPQAEAHSSTPFRSTSNIEKLPTYERRTSLAHDCRRKRNSFGARCA